MIYVMGQYDSMRGAQQQSLYVCQLNAFKEKVVFTN